MERSICPIAVIRFL